ncbi:MAG: hypothetical protein ABL933_11985 [Methyloglobulus sp.]|nr:hypothetical protein [Methyloglobulus sp.]
MNLTQIKCLAVFALFAIIGFGPVSPGCLIGMYVVLARPLWFKTLVHNLYGNTILPEPAFTADSVKQSKQARVKCFMSLLVLFIVDIAPVPVTPVIAFGIILGRPLWFYLIVLRIYGKD